MADAILAERNRVPEAGDWQARAMAVCQDLRRVLLAHTDGAELVASMSAFGLGGRGAYEDLRAILGRTAAGVEVPAGPTAPAAAVLPREGGLTDRAAGRAARTLLHFVYGHAVDEQTYDQLARFGAVAKDRDAGDFAAGVELILAGIAQAVSTTTP
ncbi:MAG: TetR/AcrR family transcriptional regulator C-terminal domain-containing protein [Nocardioides sp.]